MSSTPNKKCVGHEPCPECGSKDNLARYEDGSGYCFTPGCNTYFPPEGEPVKAAKAPTEGENFVWQEGGYKTLKARGIKRETCEKYGYRVVQYQAKKNTDPHHNEWCHVADFRKNGKLVAQKIRFPDKDFRYNRIGNKHLLWGMHLWREGGKRLVITEGEIDCMSVAQVFACKWPVVSVPNGASSAKRAIQDCLEYVESFDEVVLYFDQDDCGREAAEECALVLSPGKAKLVSAPLKDANDLLVAQRGGEIVECIHEAPTYRPDGIISGKDTWNEVSKILEVNSMPYPWDHFNKKSYGMRGGEIVMVTAGSGIGKSSLCREIAYYLFMQVKDQVGYIGLEESVAQTARAFMSLEAEKALHLDPKSLSKKRQHEVWDKVLNHDRIQMYDHWGSADSDTLLSKMRYMVKGLGCKWLFLDHISIMISGNDVSTDERRMIDNAMTKFRQFVEETQCCLFIVSHLKKRQNGKAFEDGGRISVADLRGSGALYQLSDMVIGLERDQQAKGRKANKTTVRWLKNRFAGMTGISGYLEYDMKTGRMISWEDAQIQQDFTPYLSEDKQEGQPDF